MESSDDFGLWLRSERELRGISVFFVAARTRIPPERVAAIEAGEVSLGRDGHARQTARQLASAIGADPEEAVAHLRARSARASGLTGRIPSSWAAAAAAAVALLVAGALGFGVLRWWSDDAGSDRRAEVVYSTDYVEELLSDEE